jgi:hypothetical protein
MWEPRHLKPAPPAQKMETGEQQVSERKQKREAWIVHSERE